MSNKRKQFILLAIAFVIALITWLFTYKLLLTNGIDMPYWFLLAPITASFLLSGLPRAFGLPIPIIYIFMAVIMIIGWYCPLALLALKRCPLSKRNRILCTLGVIIIWGRPIVGMIIAKLA